MNDYSCVLLQLYTIYAMVEAEPNSNCESEKQEAMG